jgi:hypothetical protein
MSNSGAPQTPGSVTRTIVLPNHASSHPNIVPAPTEAPAKHSLASLDSKDTSNTHSHTTTVTHTTVHQAAVIRRLHIQTALQELVAPEAVNDALCEPLVLDKSFDKTKYIPGPLDPSEATPFLTFRHAVFHKIQREASCMEENKLEPCTGHVTNIIERRLTAPHGVLFITVARFEQPAPGVYLKNTDPIDAPRELLHCDVAFRLIASITHHGENLSVGHYTANVNIAGKWWLCDDDRISEQPHGPNLQDAYLLAYCNKATMQSNQSNQMIEEGHNPPNVDTKAVPRNQSIVGPRPLRNKNNTCFMGAVVQFIRCILGYFPATTEERHANPYRTNLRASDNMENLVRQDYKQFNKLDARGRRRQQDASEVIDAVIQQTGIEPLFLSRSMQTTSCGTCGVTRSVGFPDSTLALLVGWEKERGNVPTEASSGAPLSIAVPEVTVTKPPPPIVDSSAKVYIEVEDEPPRLPPNVATEATHVPLQRSTIPTSNVVPKVLEMEPPKQPLCLFCHQRECACHRREPPVTRGQTMKKPPPPVTLDMFPKKSAKYAVHSDLMTRNASRGTAPIGIVQTPPQVGKKRKRRQDTPVSATKPHAGGTTLIGIGQTPPQVKGNKRKRLQNTPLGGAKPDRSVRREMNELHQWQQTPPSLHKHELNLRRGLLAKGTPKDGVPIPTRRATDDTTTHTTTHLRQPVFLEIEEETPVHKVITIDDATPEPILPSTTSIPKDIISCVVHRYCSMCKGSDRDLSAATIIPVDNSRPLFQDMVIITVFLRGSHEINHALGSSSLFPCSVAGKRCQLRHLVRPTIVRRLERLPKHICFTKYSEQPPQYLQLFQLIENAVVVQLFSLVHTDKDEAIYCKDANRYTTVTLPFVHEAADKGNQLADTIIQAELMIPSMSHPIERVDMVFKRGDALVVSKPQHIPTETRPVFVPILWMKHFFIAAVSPSYVQYIDSLESYILPEVRTEITRALMKAYGLVAVPEFDIDRSVAQQHPSVNSCGLHLIANMLRLCNSEATLAQYNTPHQMRRLPERPFLLGGLVRHSAALVATCGAKNAAVEQTPLQPVQQTSPSSGPSSGTSSGDRVRKHRIIRKKWEEYMKEQQDDDDSELQPIVLNRSLYPPIGDADVPIIDADDHIDKSSSDAETESSGEDSLANLDDEDYAHQQRFRDQVGLASIIANHCPNHEQPEEANPDDGDDDSDEEFEEEGSDLEEREDDLMAAPREDLIDDDLTAVEKWGLKSRPKDTIANLIHTKWTKEVFHSADKKSVQGYFEETLDPSRFDETEYYNAIRGDNTITAICGFCGISAVTTVAQFKAAFKVIDKNEKLWTTFNQFKSSDKRLAEEIYARGVRLPNVKGKPQYLRLYKTAVKRHPDDDTKFGVFACPECFQQLEKPDEKLPARMTRELGAITPDLRNILADMTLGEQLCCVQMRVCNYVVTINGRSRKTTGNAVVLQCDHIEIMAGALTFPPSYLQDMLHVLIIGRTCTEFSQEYNQVRQKVLRVVKARREKILLFLKCLKDVYRNPLLRNINLEDAVATQAKLDQIADEYVHRATSQASSEEAIQCQEALDDDEHGKEVAKDTPDAQNERQGLTFTDEQDLPPLDTEWVTLGDSGGIDVSRLFRLRASREAVNEFTQNDRIMNGAFPFLFPLGNLTTKGVDLYLIRSLLSHHDRRWARDEKWLFLVHNQYRRHALLRSLKTDPSSAQECANLIQRVLTRGDAEPLTDKEINLLMNKVSIVGSSDAFTAAEKKGMLRKALSMCRMRGPFTLLLTISPSFANGVLGVKLMLAAQEITAGSQRLDPTKISSRFNAALADPALSVIFFRYVVDQTIAAIQRGLFGRSTGHASVTQAQGKGLLHAHIMVWLAITPSMIQDSLRDVDLRELVMKWVDHLATHDFESIIKETTGTLMCSAPLNYTDPDGMAEITVMDPSSPSPDATETSLANEASRAASQLRDFLRYRGNRNDPLVQEKESLKRASQPLCLIKLIAEQFLHVEHTKERCGEPPCSQGYPRGPATRTDAMQVTELFDKRTKKMILEYVYATTDLLRDRKYCAHSNPMHILPEDDDDIAPEQQDANSTSTICQCSIQDQLYPDWTSPLVIVEPRCPHSAKDLITHSRIVRNAIADNTELKVLTSLVSAKPIIYYLIPYVVDSKQRETLRRALPLMVEGIAKPQNQWHRRVGDFAPATATATATASTTTAAATLEEPSEPQREQIGSPALVRKLMMANIGASEIPATLAAYSLMIDGGAIETDCKYQHVDVHRLIQLIAARNRVRLDTCEPVPENEEMHGHAGDPMDEGSDIEDDERVGQDVGPELRTLEIDYRTNKVWSHSWLEDFMHAPDDILEHVSSAKFAVMYQGIPFERARGRNGYCFADDHPQYAERVLAVRNNVQPIVMTTAKPPQLPAESSAGKAKKRWLWSQWYSVLIIAPNCQWLRDREKNGYKLPLQYSQFLEYLQHLQQVDTHESRADLAYVMRSSSGLQTTKLQRRLLFKWNTRASILEDADDDKNKKRKKGQPPEESELPAILLARARNMVKEASTTGPCSFLRTFAENLDRIAAALQEEAIRKDVEIQCVPSRGIIEATDVAMEAAHTRLRELQEAKALRITTDYGQLVAPVGEQRVLLELCADVIERNRVTCKPSIIVLQAGAGTGKSETIKNLRYATEMKYGKNTVIVGAFSWLASLNVGGKALSFTMGIARDAHIGRVNKGKNEELAAQFKDAVCLVIDEVSQIDPLYFLAISYRLQDARKCSLPFGGIPLILCVGDFNQIPPPSGRSLVVTPKDASYLRNQKKSISEKPEFTAIAAEARKKTQIRAAQQLFAHATPTLFEKDWRQGGCDDLKQLLALFRDTSNKTQARAKELQERVEKATFHPATFMQMPRDELVLWANRPVVLVASNKERHIANSISARAFTRIRWARNPDEARPLLRFRCLIHSKAYSTAQIADLLHESNDNIQFQYCDGAAVRFHESDTKSRDLDLFNGSAGYFAGILVRREVLQQIEDNPRAAVINITDPNLFPAAVYIRLKSPDAIDVDDDDESDLIPVFPMDLKEPVSLPGDKPVHIRFRTIPLDLAFALTSYKCQGQTLSKVLVVASQRPARQKGVMQMDFHHINVILSRTRRMADIMYTPMQPQDLAWFASLQPHKFIVNWRLWVLNNNVLAIPHSIAAANRGDEAAVRRARLDLVKQLDFTMAPISIDEAAPPGDTFVLPAGATTTTEVPVPALPKRPAARGKTVVSPPVTNNASAATATVQVAPTNTAPSKKPAAKPKRIVPSKTVINASMATATTQVPLDAAPQKSVAQSTSVVPPPARSAPKRRCSNKRVPPTAAQDVKLPPPRKTIVSRGTTAPVGSSILPHAPAQTLEAVLHSMNDESWGQQQPGIPEPKKETKR